MNVNFGIFPPLDRPIQGKKERGRAMAQRSLEALAKFILENRIEQRN